MKALVQIYLAPEGCERLALHGAESVWHWYVSARVVAVERDGVMGPRSQLGGTESGVVLLETMVDVPPSLVCAATAVEALDNAIAQERADSQKRLTELVAKKNSLLSITYEEPKQ